MRQRGLPGRGFPQRKTSGRKKQVRFLIITEDTKSSVLYFRSLIREAQGIDAVIQSPAATPSIVHISNDSVVRGCGMATLRLLEEAKRIRDREQTPFDRCWIVFDKDDFSDFNQAIRESKDAGFKVAWSNESFELWYLLHFRYQSTSIDRTKCITYLNKEIQRKVPSFSYNKGRTDMYDILKAYGDRKLAMSGAQRLRSNYTDHDYQKHNPCTHIDELVKDLTDGSVREQILQRGVKR